MMKSVVLTVVAVLFGMAVQPSLGVVLFQDGFESAISEPGDAPGTPVIGDSWTVIEDDTNDVGVSSSAMSGVKAALLQRLNSDPFNTVLEANLSVESTTMIETNGRATISYGLLKSSQSDSSATAGIAAKDGETKILSVAFEDDGRITCYNGATTDTGLTYTLGVYQEVEISINFATGIFTISVEGNVTVGSRNIPFWNAANSMTSVAHLPGKDAVYRIDDFEVSTSDEAQAEAVFHDAFENAVAEPGDAAGTPLIGDSWTIEEDDTGDVGISGLVNSGAKAALFQRLNGDPFVTEAYANLTTDGTAAIESNGRATIEFAINKRLENDSSALAIFGARNDASDVFQVRFDDNGKVLHYDGATVHDPNLLYTMDEYQYVEIAVDFMNQRYTVSVEGETVAGATDIPFMNTEATMTSFDITAGKDAVFRVDDLLITTKPLTCAELRGLGFGVAGDVNGDCYVNLADLAIMASEWLYCMAPDDAACDTPWIE